MVFKERPVGKNKIKGIDITAPPSLPKHFSIMMGCSKYVYIGSDSESEDELNTAMQGDGDN